MNKKFVWMMVFLSVVSYAYAAVPVIDGKLDAGIYTGPTAQCDTVTLGGMVVGYLYKYIDSNGDLNVYYEQSKSLNDNTYGTNIVNWSRDHKFGDLTGSDKAQFVIKNSLGTTVLDLTIDYITATSTVPSGYASLGVSGGEGRINSGSAANVLAAKTSIDYNFNVLNYVLTTNSPPTVSSTSYTLPVGSPYTGWIFEDSYEFRISKNAVGSAGFGIVDVVSVHNSPPKIGSNAATPNDCGPFCGNGVVEQGEQCDDGNLINGDGCSAQCTLEQIADLDFGDAPINYPTLLANNGAMHKIVPGFFLGNLIDAEQDGQPTPLANGDNLNNLNDEDGVVFNTPLMPCMPATITVMASMPGKLDAWVDFNADGDWNDPGEQIFTGQLLVPGPNLLLVNVPCGANIGSTYSRFRLSSAGGLAPTGLANDGEVEDYILNIGEAQPVCGNGVLEPGEQCDDGNNLGGDGCSANCQLEDSCYGNIAPVMNFLMSSNLTINYITHLNWSWYDSDNGPNASMVYLFYSTDEGITWEIIDAVSANYGSATPGYGAYDWNASDILVDPLPDSVMILGIIYDGCDVGLGDLGNAAEVAEQHDPTDPYDIVSTANIVPEFSTMGIIAILAIVVLVYVFRDRLLPRKASTKSKKR